MNVLLVLDQTTSTEGESVALKRYQPILAGLRKRGIGLHLATLRPPGRFNHCLSEQVTTHALFFEQLTDAPAAAIRLAAVLARSHFDVIHAEETIPALVAGLAGLSCPRATRVFVRHHTSGSQALHAASRVASKLNHFTLGVSEATIAAAVELDRVPPERTLFVRNGVPEPGRPDPRQTERLRFQLGIAPGDLVVGSVGRPRREKNHVALIEATAPILARSDPTVHLVIVGGGPEADTLWDIAAGCDRIHLTGHQEDVAPWYALADVIAIPSAREAFPLSTLEAMASRKPIVATAVGGLLEQVRHGETGLLVEPGSTGALRNGIAALLASRERRRAMGEAGYRRYKASFTLDHMLDGWLSAWSRVISARSARRLSGRSR